MTTINDDDIEYSGGSRIIDLDKTVGEVYIPGHNIPELKGEDSQRVMNRPVSNVWSGVTKPDASYREDLRHLATSGSALESHNKPDPYEGMNHGELTATYNALKKSLYQQMKRGDAPSQQLKESLNRLHTRLSPDNKGPKV